MQVEYMYLKGQSQQGTKWMCVGKATIQGQDHVFFSDKKTKSGARDAVANLILTSQVMKEYILSGPSSCKCENCECSTASKEPKSSCSAGCNDGSQKKLGMEVAHRLDAELDQYMKQTKEDQSESEEKAKIPKKVRIQVSDSSDDAEDEDEDEEEISKKPLPKKTFARRPSPRRPPAKKVHGLDKIIPQHLYEVFDAVVVEHPAKEDYLVWSCLLDNNLLITM